MDFWIGSSFFFNVPLILIYPRSNVTCEAQASGLENTQIKQNNYEPRVLMSDVIKITVECVEC